MSLIKVQQVGARGVDGVRANSNWRGDRLSRRGCRPSCLAEDQDAVQRRAQLVPNMLVEELGLYFEVKRQLRLAFSSTARRRLLDLRFLRSDLDVLLGEAAGPSCASCSLVCCSPSAGPGSSAASVCDCLSSASGLHGGFDRVQHDAEVRVICSRNASCEAPKLSSEASSIPP